MTTQFDKVYWNRLVAFLSVPYPVVTFGRSFALSGALLRSSLLYPRHDYTLLTAAEDWVKDGRICMGREAIGVCHEQRLSCSSTLSVCGFLVCGFSSSPSNAFWTGCFRKYFRERNRSLGSGNSGRQGHHHRCRKGRLLQYLDQ